MSEHAELIGCHVKAANAVSSHLQVDIDHSIFNSWQLGNGQTGFDCEAVE